MASIAVLLVLPAYLAAAGITLWQTRPGSVPATDQAGRAAAPSLAAVGMLIHALVLGHHAATSGILTVSDTLSLTGWLMAAVSLWMLTRSGLRGLAVMLLPLAGLMALPAVWYDPAQADPGSYPWTTRTHIGLSLVAWTTLTLGAALAILMAIQHNRLRTRRMGGGMGGLTSLLPPLDTTERALFTTITVGFLMLSLSILSGLMFIENMFAQHLVHKTALSIAAWVIFGVLLLGRWRFGWRGHVALGWTLAGFGALALAYFGSRIVLEFLLQQHWG